MKDALREAMTPIVDAYFTHELFLANENEQRDRNDLIEDLVRVAASVTQPAKDERP